MAEPRRDALPPEQKLPPFNIMCKPVCGVCNLDCAYCYYTMKPAQQLVDNGFCLAQPGQRYLVYLPDGGKVNVNIEPGVQYEIVWIDAQDPSTRHTPGTTTYRKAFAAPAGGDDWLLSLTRVCSGEKPDGA